jgi:predicted transcriptional regulator
MSAGNSLETRALQLLGDGVSPEQVASALGVTASRISQLLSQEEFAAEVSSRKFNNLQKHNARDATYDAVEDALIGKFQDTIPLMMRPMEILRAIQVINSAKRRGHAAPDAIHQQQTIVQLNMPVQLVQHFTKDVNNQVIEAGDQKLLTIQSNKLRDISRDRKELPNGRSNEKGVKATPRITNDTINNL